MAGEILSDQNLMEILKCSMEPDVVQFIKIKCTVIAMKDFTAFLHMRRYQNWARKIGS